MDKFLPRIVTCLVTRLIFHLVDTIKKQTSVEQKIRRLQQVMLKVHATIEEAEVRHISNQQMLVQLEKFLDGMYQGCYELDNFQCQNIKEDMSDEVQQTFTYSLANPAKRLRMIANKTRVLVFGDSDVNRLQAVLENLEAIVADLHEFNTFMGCYPRRFQQPFNAYLYIDKCMFGRHLEKQQVINFLLQPKPTYSTTKVDILPIIGEPWVGKRTLVENVCSDERVKNHFYFIVNLDGNDLESGQLTTEGVTLVMEKQNFRSRKSLVVIEITSDIDKETWRRFYLYACNSMAAGSKIILTSAIEEVTQLGTVDSLRLKRISEEAYWYFFKVLSFGSTNAEEHPKLVAIAMEMAKMFRGCFIAAHAFGHELRANTNFQFWSHALRSASAFAKRNYITLCKYPTSSPKKSIAKNIYIKIFCSSPNCCIWRKGKRHVIHGKLPELTVHDILSSGYMAIPPGMKFEVTWRSPLPPYDDYVATGVRTEQSSSMSNKCDVDAV